MRLGDSDITVEESDRWQKFVMPADRNPWALGLYSVLMIVWLGMLVVIIAGLLGPFGPTEIRALFVVVWRLLLILWLIVWIWFARRWLWRTWQYYAASREILFVNEEELIVRRPVSLLGVTNVYDMAHVSPLAWNETEAALSFGYGTQPVFFGRGLDRESASELASLINHRYLSHVEEEL